jgi:protein pelota
MIVKDVKGSSEKAYYVIPEDADDLLTVRRIIEKDDQVISVTSRVIKQIKEYSRPDKGDRVKIRVALNVEKVSLDSLVDRLRISGIITNTDNDLVPRGAHHSLTIQIGDSITIDKGREWQASEIAILKRSLSNAASSFILVAIDNREAAVAKLSGTHLNIIQNIYSGYSGKRYPQHSRHNSQDTFLGDIARMIRSIDRTVGDTVDTDVETRILVFGPGETKRTLYNFLMTDKPSISNERLLIVNGVDVAGEDGILVFLRSDSAKDVMSTSKIVAVSKIIDEIMRQVQKGIPKYAMGMKEVSKAASVGAIESLAFSDSVYSNAEEDTIIHLLNNVERQGANTYAVDSSTDMGLRVTSLGGIVALLRYHVS